MVDPKTLDYTFVQNGKSCILASYAVGACHFTGLKVHSYFWDYCRHFNISPSSNEDAELKYNDDFHPRYKTCSGYKIIEHLHNCSQQGAFVQSRAKFGVEYIHQPFPRLQEIERRLRNEEVLVSVAFRVSPIEVHSCCVGFNGQGFYMIETRGPEPKTGIVTIPNIQYINESLGSLQDSLLMFARQQTSTKSSGGNYGLR